MDKSVNLYDILALPALSQLQPTLSKQTLRSAYRRALLQHHPDKSAGTKTSEAAESGQGISIDAITHAYTVLSDPQRRQEYDATLILAQPRGDSRGVSEQQAFRTVETVDLDDLRFDEAANVWFRDCRCGDERGFTVHETDLEEAADEGMIDVGCKGCSLWIKLLFSTEEVEVEQT